MPNEQTIWQAMKEAWTIKKKDIKDMGINPDKPWSEITLNELWQLSDFLEVTTGELIENT